MLLPTLAQRALVAWSIALLATVARAAPGPSSPEGATCPRCSVVLIVLDAARADHFGAYGYARQTTPFIDSLAERSVVFERATSEASYTIASVSSLLSGLPVGSHRVESVMSRLSPSIDTLAEALRRSGRRTGAFTENPLIEPDLGLAQGFETFRVWGRQEHPSAEDFDVSDAPRHVDEMLAWVGERTGRGEPVFLYAHLLRPHQPYEPLPQHVGTFRLPYEGTFRGGTRELVAVQMGDLHPDAADRRHLIDLYDENLRSADWLVERLVTGLRRFGAFDDAIVIVTADHGEELFDHGGVLHGSQVYQEGVRVPLVIRLPDRMGVAPQRQRSLVQLRDLVPTVMQVLGQPATAFSRGRGLLPAMRAGTEVGERFGLVSRGTKESGLVALRSGPLKYVANRRDLDAPGRLYDLAADPGETRDVGAARATERDALAARLRAVLRLRRRASFPAKNGRPKDTLVQGLRALGYIE